MAAEKNPNPNHIGICIRKQTHKTQTQTLKPTNPEILRILHQLYREMLSSGEEDQILCSVDDLTFPAASNS